MSEFDVPPWKLEGFEEIGREVRTFWILEGNVDEPVRARDLSLFREPSARAAALPRRTREELEALSREPGPAVGAPLLEEARVSAVAPGAEELTLVLVPTSGAGVWYVLQRGDEAVAMGGAPSFANGVTVHVVPDPEASDVIFGLASDRVRSVEIMDGGATTLELGRNGFVAELRDAEAHLRAVRVTHDDLTTHVLPFERDSSPGPS